MTAPEEPTISANARKWKLEVDLADAPAPADWQAVIGVQDFKPMNAPTMQDDGSYDDEGYGSSSKTGLAWSLEIEVVRRRAVTNDTVYDAGQERLRTQADLFGQLGVAHVRWYDREGGPEAYEGWAEIEWAPKGGKRTDLELVTVKLSGKGKRFPITNPLADPAVVPTVTSVTPNNGGIAGGTQVDIRGSQFVGLAGAAAVKFSGTNATSYIVVSDSRIVAVAPAHAAGAGNVTVTNAAGTSATGPANAYTYV